MPEYLAPGVYVEEVDTGSKPIEGVSTSTAGMVGVTERGPVDVPVLVTGAGEYARWFGGLLRRADFAEHRFLPHAVAGFFTNGGRRLFVTRVLDPAATRTLGTLFDRGAAGGAATTLLRAAGEATGSAVGRPPLLVLPAAGIGDGDWLRVGDGSTAEYHRADGAPVAETVLVSLHLPLSRAYAPGEGIEQYTRATLPQACSLAAGAAPGDRWVVVRAAAADVAALGAGDWLEVGAPATAEYRRAVEVQAPVPVPASPDATVRVLLDAALTLAVGGGAPVRRIDLAAGAAATAVITAATSGSGLVFVEDRGGDLDDRTALVVVGDTVPEMRRLGELTELDLAIAAYDDYPAGALVEAVVPAGDRTLAADADAGDDELVLQAGQGAGLVVGQRVVLVAGAAGQTLAITDRVTDTLSVTPPVAADQPAGTAVVPAPKATTAAVPAGARVLALDDRMGIGEGTLLSVAGDAGAELVTVLSLPATTSTAPDPGNVAVHPALAGSVPLGADITVLGSAVPVAGRQATVLALPAAAGSTDLVVTDGAGFAAGETVRVTVGGSVSYHPLAAAGTPLTGAGAAAGDRPLLVTLRRALARAHAAGAAVVARDPLLDVQALDPGSWGDRLRVSVEDETPGLVSSTLATIVDAGAVRLASASGVQAGTVLELVDLATGAVVGDPVKVSAVDRAASFTLRLAGAGLAPQQQVIGLGVRSREFRLTVRLLRQPDPRTPSRNEEEIDSETFRYLSLDPRHSNYVERVIGDVDGDLRLWDRRPEGSSLYVRVRDRAADQQEAEQVRLGPETLVDVLPDGRRRPARLRLEQVRGSDSIGTLTADHYVGADHVDPDLRTGLQSLRNVEEISIVAVPGRTEAQVQQALIDHCELLRYRFAVLDSRPEPADTIADVRDLRQQFDTRYAALYYPWLAIPDPYPETDEVADYAVPPAGHVLGVYARTDVDRGVHKAPANEVVRGIVGLRRRVTREQQEILNPYPTNINVIRDFRDNNRGIRVYGGRVITSDSDWKYVNVRRLLIFIEASVERGLQWVVFEPNAEPLWARVRRVIANFLTVVWRNGALEGVVPEEAFFVKCDRTTMTQTEIDNGQLIVLVGVAPVKPAEFVIVRIGLWTARSDT